MPTPKRLRRLLMVAYDFPPLKGSSGIQRTLRLVQQLPSLGCEPSVPATAARMRLREDGSDEGSFARAKGAARAQRSLEQGRVVLLHSGIDYRSERDPTELFKALARIKAAGPPALRVRFLAAVHEALPRELAQRYDVADMIELAPPLPYLEALQEMLRADGLLLMQAANCNEQVPAKLYEYLRARRPVLCLADAAGDTWRVLESCGLRHMADLADAGSIARLLERFVRDGADGLLASEQAVAGASRAGRAAALVHLLEQCTAEVSWPAGAAA